MSSVERSQERKQKLIFNIYINTFLASEDTPGYETNMNFLGKTEKLGEQKNMVSAMHILNMKRCVLKHHRINVNPLSVNNLIESTEANSLSSI